MNFKEYCESIKDVEISDDLEFSMFFLCLHPRGMPLGLVTPGYCEQKIIKVPAKVIDRFGIIVPVMAIAIRAFAGNTNVTDIVLPPGINRICKEAFAGCTNLKNITIPKTVKRIPEKAFEGCINLENVYYEGAPEEWNKIKIVHDKHEIEFGGFIPGTRVLSTTAERRRFVPENEALFKANMHFRCDLEEFYRYPVNSGAHGKDMTFKHRDTDSKKSPSVETQ